ncbi:MAG: peptidyl-prolyl cis-trans isomerase (rotamase) - cyclophilin family [Rhodocyclaceae bacterium]|nr:peptidyl-prolyl cis-trans isomerase (rotamase) - cyclophilin family [Rhodocyclaceae bacterium]
MKTIKNLLAVAAGVLLTTSAWAAPTVEMQTNQGKIVVELSPDKAPESVANFLKYARDGFYNGTIFHRVIPGFMIQGGGFDEKMSQKPTRAPVRNEANNGLHNARGTIAMARTSQPHSATAQFFINHADNRNLDHPSFDGWGYAVFGKVTQGMDVVDKIAQVPTTTAGMHQNVPQTPVVIQNVKIISEK